MTQAQANVTDAEPGIAIAGIKDGPPLPEGLVAADLVEVCRQMILVRAMDERIWMMNRQGKVPIAASCQGHEASQLGSLLAAQKDGDCFLFPYYRDLAIKMAAGLTPRQVMLSFMGKEGEPYSGARQFPLQGADLPRRIIQISNVVAAGLTQSVGYALGCKMAGDATVTLCYFGDGATSQGETHEAMNFAAIHKLPVLFICENNKYAISTPQESQMVVSDVAARAEGYGFPGFVIDGLDTIACYEATRQGIEHARKAGPALIEMKVERFMPHTTDDDDRRYRDRDALDAARHYDPVSVFPAQLVERGIVTPEEVDAFREEAQQQVNDATDFADAAAPPDAATIYDHLYVGEGA
ncbi:MAG: thiamine pyrophosphate-dependent dehydrogenase E1 component subunit alpha [Chloroflexi bacterium]|nr:thiamine pyrophosphate-dependent dehydrogenase E1 component subunit alpha [Chloroflexota bacterium]MYD48703.1 thiamine pyrophosphate-dependent dehydrogenase E1 component subunit alpha [Chloroflexota bacterium]